MNLPIIITHFGDSYFLPYVFSQIKKSNPNKKIILLGDSSNQYYQGLVDWFDINSYFNQAAEFAKHYVHLSTNNHRYELFCFQRWFAILEFMKQNNINKAWCMDSDVMVYANLTDHEKRLSRFALSYNDVSGGCCLINDFNFFERIPLLMSRYYTNRINLEKLKNHLIKPIHQKLVGSVSDMYFFADLKIKNPNEIGDLSAAVEGSMFDSNIYLQENIQMEGDIKKILWDENRPYGYNINGDKIYFIVLHFASRLGKKLIKKSYRYSDVMLNNKQKIIFYWHNNLLARLVRKFIK